MLFVYMVMQPMFGALSDRIGRKTNMLLFGGLGTLMHGAAADAARDATRTRYRPSR